MPQGYLLIILFNNSEVEVSHCLGAVSEAIAQDGERKWQVLLWDNGSTNALEQVSPLLRRGVRYHRSPRNIGFGAAVNRAVEHFGLVDDAVLVLLNPDCTIAPDTLAQLGSAVARGHLAAPQLVDEDGAPTPVLLAIRGPFGEAATFFSRRIGPPRWHYASGACLGIPVKAFRKAGGFDERFFLYGEEADLEHRMAMDGVQLVRTPSVCRHTGSQGWQGKSELAQAHLYHSKVLMARKWQGACAALVVEAGAVTALLLRIAFNKGGRARARGVLAEFTRIQSREVLRRMAEVRRGRPGRGRAVGGGVLFCQPSADLYGSDRMALETIAVLRDAGLRVVVALPARGRFSDSCEELGVDQRVVPVPVLRKALQTPRGAVRYALETATGIVRACREVRRERPGLVYVNTLTQPAWILAAKITRTPVICHVREAEGALGSLRSAVLTMPLRLADELVYNSAHTADWVRRSQPGLRDKPGRIIYNGKDWSRFRASGAADAATDLPVRPRWPAKLLVVGRLSPRKGQDTVLDAYPDALARGLADGLVLVGDAYEGYEYFEEDLRRRVAECGLEESVDFRGFVADVQPVLAEADVLLVPSRTEPFGTVVLEGVAAGLPVVVSRVGGLSELADLGLALSVDPESPGGLVSALESMRDDPAAVRERMTKAVQVVDEVFAPENYARQMTDVVRGHLRRRGEAGS
jgi:glycosyltransferase involved in cell wall biosynthesis/GT2 family glycosyltransferase